jgi:hypothetical protein
MQRKSFSAGRGGRTRPRALGFACTIALLGIRSVALAASPLQEEASFTGSGNAFLGYSVAVSGGTMIVGALNDHAGTGAAYVYAQNGVNWTLVQQLVAQDGAANDQFGSAVAISGTTALVGAPGKASGQGFVYVFTQTGGSWSQQEELPEPAGGTSGDAFGCSVAVSGRTAVVGASAASGNLGGFSSLRTRGPRGLPRASSTGLSPASDLVRRLE